MRQIRAARGFPDIAADYPVSVRLVRGLTSLTAGFLASGIVLPGGEAAILLAQPVQGSAAGKQAAAERAISGFASDDYVAAIVDAEGKIEAASRAATKLKLDHEAIMGLVREVGREEDRLVKKLVPAGPRRIPAGIARLTDDPALHLLVIVEAATETVSENPEAVAGEGNQPARSGAPDSEENGTRSQRPAPVPAPVNANSKDAGHEDHWYFEAGEESARPKSAAPQPDANHSSTEKGAEGRTQPALNPTDVGLPSSPMKFVWRTDENGRFNAISDDFVRALGGAPEEIIGQSFAEVAAALGFDRDGEIAHLLEHRDTWSGRSVMWPVKGTALSVPVDLAGLPIYGRERLFEGFRGFGVARFGEAAALPPPPAQAAEAASSAAHREGTETGQRSADNGGRGEAAPREANDRAGDGLEAPIDDLSGHDPFKGEPPALAVERGPDRRFSDKIIRLAEHRPLPPESGLSSAERHAFKEIGARLKKESASRASAGEMPDATAVGEREAERQSAADAAKGDAAARSEEAEASLQEAAEAGHEMQAGAAEDDKAPVAPSGRGTAEAGGDGPGRPPADEDTAAAKAADEAPGVEASAEKAGEQTSKAVFNTAAGNAVPSAFFLPAHVRPEFYATILSNLPLPVLVHAGDILHYANPHFLELVGYSSIEDIRSAGGLGELFADPSLNEAGKERKLCLKHRSGETFPVEAFLQSVPWENGKALLMALRRAGKEAEASPETGMLQSRISELGAIIDTATDGVVLIDKDGTIRSISRPAEALFGFDNADVVGKPFAFLFAIESQRAARDYLAGLSDNGVASVLNDGLELIGREAEGRFIPLFMTIGRLPHENGYCAVVRDITQWKRAEEELTQARSLAERASSQKTDFLARVSHEIRTPLNAIIGFSELIMDEKFGPVGNERYRDYLRDINRSGNHVLDLVNDLLDISKIEAGEQEMSYEAVSLNETLAETVAMMQPQANRERVIIRSSFLSRLPEVVADLRSMRQIALNLMSNAIRYTQAGGQVIVSTAYEPTGEVVMRVRDTGIGMSQAEIEQALKPFKQLNALKRPRGDGTGLGLPLTKAMVEANRARFSINSIPGEGTLVEISFPSTRVLAD
jgi:PAS domain S-box-containing protein